MTKTNRPRPWHQVVRLKDELRTGELALAEFAADLHEVAQARGRRPVYEDPAKFFALTYPTHALRELVRDVAARLAGRSDKAVRQLELTYGGGKTHTLITLHHLFRDPAGLPDLPAVREFREHVGADLPQAFTAALCFDKIDAERGIEGVRGPGGETRALRHPWSVLAFLPKLLHPNVLLDTVLQGVERGLFVARLVRPDGTARTWWRETVDPEARSDPQLEVVLPGKCELGALSADLLGPGVLPELWDDGTVTIPALRDYFAGGRAVRIPREGYDETQVVPRCGEPALLEAVREAVERGGVWLTNGPASVWREQIPYGVLNDAAVLRTPPDPVPAQALSADALPGAWRDGATNGAALTRALSQSRRTTLPWGLVREGIRAGVESRWLEVAEGSAAVGCAYDQAGQLRLKRPAEVAAPPPPPPVPAAAGALLEGSQIQDLAELVPKLLEASAGSDLRFRVAAVLRDDAGGSVPEEVKAALAELLATVSGELEIR